jgi:hypothetical protein
MTLRWFVVNFEVFPKKNHLKYLLQNGQPQNPYCAGVGGIIGAYQQAIVNVQLWGTAIVPLSQTN